MSNELSATSMAQQELHTILTRTLCSYPLRGNIVVLSGVTRRDMIIVAHACAMIPGVKLILVDDGKDRLAEAKAFIVSQNPAAKEAIYTFAAENMDQERIATIFVTIQSKFGIPKVLILGNASRPCRKRLLEYSAKRSLLDFTADDIITYMDFSDDQQKGFIRSFLTCGHNQEKTLINISRVIDTSPTLPSLENEGSLGFLLAHVRRGDSSWKFTLEGLPENRTSTRLFQSAWESTDRALNNGKFGLVRSPQSYGYLTLK